jgi:RHS repeat-associated protein
MNGSTQQQYDDLYRLTKAYGELKSSKGDASYSLTMKYDDLHNITHKELGHTVFGSYPAQSNYKLEYQYSQERPHQLSQIKELTVTAGEEKTHKYSYDSNGNMVHRQEDIHYRSLIWDEENRLMGVNDEGYASRYVYDDTGERVLKSSGGVTQVSVNGTSMGTMEDMKNYTGYLSPYFVFKEGSFTKHIYAGTERIVSQIGNGEFNNNSGGLGGNGITAGGLNFAQVQDWYEVQKEKYIASLGVPPGPPDKKGIYASPQYTGKPWPDFGSPLNSSLNTPPKGWPKMPVFNPPGGPPGPPVQFGPAQTNDSIDGGWGYQGTGTFEEDRYFYHHDHLGSSSYLTNQLGNITQHVEYIPFGEVFVEERNDKWNTPYLFNGKELDEETGLYYFSSRYYDPKVSLFYSVDALVESTMDPYGYCYQNPVKYIDPTGMSGNDWVEKSNGDIYWDPNATSQATTKEGETYLGKTYARAKQWNNVQAEGKRYSGNMLEIYKDDKTMEFHQANSSGMVELPQDNPNDINGQFTAGNTTLYSTYNRNDVKGAVEDQYGTPENIANMINAIVEYQKSYPGDIISIGDMKSPTNGRTNISSTATHHGDPGAFDIRLLGAKGSYKGTVTDVLFDKKRTQTFINALGNNGFKRFLIGPAVYQNFKNSGSIVIKNGGHVHDNHYHVDMR